MIGATGLATLDAERVILHARGASEQDVIARPQSGLLAADIASFGDALLRSETLDRLQATARQHLRTLATIEAAYLSARTGSPEAPKRFLTDFR